MCLSITTQRPGIHKDIMSAWEIFLLYKEKLILVVCFVFLLIIKLLWPELDKKNKSEFYIHMHPDYYSFFQVSELSLYEILIQSLSFSCFDSNTGTTVVLGDIFFFKLPGE